MPSIVTDVERPAGHSTPRPFVWRLVRVVAPTVAVVVLPLSIVTATAGATLSLSQAQQKAAQIESEVQATGAQVDALDQQYQAALAQKSSIDAQIAATEHKIAVSKSRIAKDRAVLRNAAIEAYVTSGASAGTNAIFDSNQTSALSSSIYDQVATGNLNISVADLTSAVAQLGTERKLLGTQEAQAAQAVAAAHGAFTKGQALEAQQQAALGQVKGQIATLVNEQRAAQAAAAQAAAAQAQAAAQVSSSPPPPSATAPPPAGGNAGTIAVRAAESQLGVPYVWGGEQPGVGFDCSGLTAWAWGQAGVPLPHYSGAQMADSTPVPISALQPGDLLFYGPGGSTHVAMYVGGGEMIEAPFPGTVVRIDPVRLGTGFAGAGRP
jgi:cell wall-associated NlpC family hydrolase